MKPLAMKDIITTWVKSLKNTEIITDKTEISDYYPNLSEFQLGHILAVVKPKTTEEVQQVVEVANITKITIYPYSTGKNWGLGSKVIPVSITDETSNAYILVDLSNMQKILELDFNLGYAVIEPGVTQGQLSSKINKKNTEFILNVTGSANDTSITGNILDRGSGVLGNRMEDFLGLEAVLGDGTVIKTGLWGLYECRNLTAQHFYPHGIGPDLSRIFFQSNLGIVTKMIVKLRRKIKKSSVFILLQESSLCNVVNIVRLLREEAVLNSIVKIDDSNNDFRFKQDDITNLQSISKYNREFLVTTNINGSDDIISAKKLEIEKKLADHVNNIVFVNSLEDHENVEKLLSITDAYNKTSLAAHFDRYDGICSDSNVSSLASLHNHKRKYNPGDLDSKDNNSGLVCLVSSLPFDGQSVVRVIDILDKCSKDFKIKPPINFTELDYTTAIAVYIPCFFARNSYNEVELTHKWLKKCFTSLEEAGFYPQRLDSLNMPDFIKNNKQYWKKYSKLKKAFDPNNIIAPEKYCFFE